MSLEATGLMSIHRFTALYVIKMWMSPDLFHTLWLNQFTPGAKHNGSEDDDGRNLFARTACWKRNPSMGTFIRAFTKKKPLWREAHTDRGIETDLFVKWISLNHTRVLPGHSRVINLTVFLNISWTYFAILITLAALISSWVHFTSHIMIDNLIL